MEFLIKLIWTLIAIAIIWGISAFTVKVWRSHVDPRATMNRLISAFQKEPTDLIATREDNAWYQNGQVVGRIVGKITEATGTLTFEEVSDTSGLRRDQDIEFRRMRIRLESSESLSGMKMVMIIDRVVQRLPPSMQSSRMRDVESCPKR